MSQNIAIKLAIGAVIGFSLGALPWIGTIAGFMFGTAVGIVL